MAFQHQQLYPNTSSATQSQPQRLPQSFSYGNNDQNVIPGPSMPPPQRQAQLNPGTQHASLPPPVPATPPTTSTSPPKSAFVQRPPIPTASSMTSTAPTLTPTPTPGSVSTSTPAQAPAPAPAPAASSSQSTPTSEAAPQPQTSDLPPLDQSRVSALLHLNSILLRQLNTLQLAGANGQINLQSPTQQSPPPPQNTVKREPVSTPSAAANGNPPTTTTPTSNTTPTILSSGQKKKAKFDNYLRRLQANIAYLLAMSQGKAVPPFPAAMEPPPDNWLKEVDDEDGGEGNGDELKGAYTRLKALWPNYKGSARPQQPVGAHAQGPKQGQQAPIQSGAQIPAPS